MESEESITASINVKKIKQKSPKLMKNSPLINKYRRLISKTKKQIVKVTIKLDKK